MRCNRRIFGRRGYTLVEMMIVVAIVGLLAAIAVPAFSGYLKRSRLQGSRNELMADIYYARSMAISRRNTFRIVFAAGQYQVVNTADGTVARTRTAPPGITFASTGDPNLYAWGLADAVDITVGGGGAGYTTLNLLPTGSITHD
jgi:prepilin-type N-terminal cleavage/methylation domain-containing protein